MSPKLLSLCSVRSVNHVSGMDVKIFQPRVVLNQQHTYFLFSTLPTELAGQGHAKKEVKLITRSESTFLKSELFFLFERFRKPNDDEY